MNIKRTTRFLIANLIVLLTISFVFHIGIASANDVGTVRIQGASVRSVYTLDTNRVIGSTPASWNVIYYDTASINHIVDFQLNLTNTWTSVNSSNFSAFTITSGGSGTGQVAYDNRFSNASLFAVYYFFDDNAIVTSSPITLTLDRNIFQGITLIGGELSYCAQGSLSSLKPIAVSSSGAACPAHPYQSAVGYNAVNVGTITNNTYNVSYFNNSNSFVIDVTKENIATKIQLLDDFNNIYFTEPVFSTNSTHFLNTSNRGLTINISTADGSRTIQLINHSPVFVAANTPAENVQNGIGMVWEYDTYTIDTTGNLTWDKTTPALACDNIKIYDEVDTVRVTIPNPNNEGFYKIMLDRSGTWKAEYRRQTLCGLSVEEVLNTAYTNVPNPEASYLVINATTIAGRQENVTYRSGRIGPFNPYLAVLNIDGIPEGKYSISGYAINVEGTSPVVINTAGLHTIRICDAFGCDPVVATTNTVFNTSIPTMNITISNITMDNTLYSFEDTAIITYAIDNFNFSNKAILITSYNWDYGVEQTRVSGFSNQTGSVQELLSFFLGRYVYTGQYSMRLVGRNDTGDYILAFWNFTISDLDAEGYMLKMSKNSLCLGESNTFKVLSPTTSTLNITLNTNGNIFNSYSINMNKTISYKPSAIGTYSVILYSPEWYVKRSFTFDVVACVTPTPTPGATQGAQQAKAMANMLMSNIFWSFIITAGLMIAIAWKTNHGMATVAIGALSMTVFAGVGWFPLWAFFSILIICATLLAANWVRQQFDIGTSG